MRRPWNKLSFVLVLSFVGLFAAATVEAAQIPDAGWKIRGDYGYGTGSRPTVRRNWAPSVRTDVNTYRSYSVEPMVRGNVAAPSRNTAAPTYRAYSHLVEPMVCGNVAVPSQSAAAPTYRAYSVEPMPTTRPAPRYSTGRSMRSNAWQGRNYLGADRKILGIYGN